MYETGRAGSTSDKQSLANPEEAIKWYRKGAQARCASAELNLGLAYFRGKGVHQNFAEAVRWFRKSADHGLAAAFDQLGVMYQHGWGVDQDYGQARKWYRAAAERGFDQAEHDLAALEGALSGVADNRRPTASNP
jgi:TPR repeat protein